MSRDTIFDCRVLVSIHISSGSAGILPAETRRGRDALAPRRMRYPRCEHLRVLMLDCRICGPEVTIARRVQPPSQPPPAGGRRRVPAPGGGGSGRGPSPCPRGRDAGGTPALPGHVHRAVCAMRMTVSRDHGGPGSPIPPPAGGFGRVAPSSWGMGKPGFPIPPPAGGFGRAVPSQEQPYVHCGVVRRSRMDG